jgi:hypothetical protein
MPTTETLESPLVEFNSDHPSISISDIQSPSNYTYYPWTLPPELVPYNATSSVMATRTTFDLSFPNLPNTAQVGGMQRVHEGILVNSMSGLRFGMIREPDTFPMEKEITFDEHFRIYSIANIALGRDEKVYMTRSTIDTFNPLDPFFTRTRDSQTLDLVVDLPPPPSTTPSSASLSDFLEDALGEDGNLSTFDYLDAFEVDVDPEALESEPSYLASLLASLQSLLSAPTTSQTSFSASEPSQTAEPEIRRLTIPGTLPTGPGAAPLPDVADPHLAYSAENPLGWSSIYVHHNTLCDERLLPEIPRNHQIIVIPRGGCSFSTKLRHIPPFPPKSSSLQLVIIVSYAEHEDDSYAFASEDESTTLHKDKDTDASTHQDRHPDPESHTPPQIPEWKPKPRTMRPQPRAANPAHGGVPLVQPLLDEQQYTPSGLPRPHPIPLIMVAGGEETMGLLRRAGEGGAVGVRRRYYFLSQGLRIGNLIIL